MNNRILFYIIMFVVIPADLSSCKKNEINKFDYFESNTVSQINKINIHPSPSQKIYDSKHKTNYKKLLVSIQNDFTTINTKLMTYCKNPSRDLKKEIEKLCKHKSELYMSELIKIIPSGSKQSATYQTFDRLIRYIKYVIPSSITLFCQKPQNHQLNIDLVHQKISILNQYIKDL